MLMAADTPSAISRIVAAVSLGDRSEWRLDATFVVPAEARIAEMQLIERQTLPHVLKGVYPNS